jgi:hypothetical protein
MEVNNKNNAALRLTKPAAIHQTATSGMEDDERLFVAR